MEMNQRGFILPIDHEDIFLFTKAIDDVLDFIDNAAETYSEIFCLSSAISRAIDFCLIIKSGTDLLVNICKWLNQSSKYSNEIIWYCISIHELENKADDLKKYSLKTQLAPLNHA